MFTVKIQVELELTPVQQADVPAVQRIQSELTTALQDIQGRYPSFVSVRDSVSGPVGRAAGESLPEEDFFAFAWQEVDKLKKACRFNTARNYRTALRRLKEFVRVESFPFRGFTPEFVEEMETYFKQKGCHLNSISCYMRTLRAIYNKGVEQEHVADCAPFRKVFTGSEGTRKRAVTAAYMKNLYQFDCSDKPNLQLAKDLFLFSFYTRGMSFIDMACLTRANICGRHLVYYRHKTHQQLTVRLERTMREIIERYSLQTYGDYLLPILHSTDPVAVYKEYREQLSLYNKHLKQLGEMLDDRYHLSSYVARHSWATLAKKKGIPLPVISESLGHTSERTTRIYMGAFEKNKLDQANYKLIKAVLDGRGKE